MNNKFEYEFENLEFVICGFIFHLYLNKEKERKKKEK